MAMTSVTPVIRRAVEKASHCKSRLLKQMVIAGLLSTTGLLSATLTLPAHAEIYVYENEYGRKLFSGRPLSEPGYTLKQTITPSGKTPHKPSTKATSGNRSQYDGHIRTAANTFEVDPALIKAVIHVESYFNSEAVSHAGAQGLMQLMPATASQYRVNDPFNPTQNIRAGSKHLSYLLRKYRNNIDLALAAYNAGEGKVRKYNGIPPYKETQNYVKKVKKLRKQYQASL